MNNDVFKGLGIEIKLKAEDDFLKVKETLTRMGVASKELKNLSQTAHILHKAGRYSILHFKEMFIMDGQVSEVSIEDIQRRNTIVKLLCKWSLLETVEPLESFLADHEFITMSYLKVVPYALKSQWTLKSHYTFSGDK